MTITTILLFAAGALLIAGSAWWLVAFERARRDQRLWAERLRPPLCWIACSTLLVLQLSTMPAAAISLGRATLPHAAAFSWSTFALGVVAAGLAGVLMAYGARRSTLPNVRDAMVLAGAMLGLFVAFPALAAEEVVAVSPTVVSAEWGPYIEVLLRWLAEAAIPGAAVAIVSLLWKTSTLARMFISEELVERTLRKWADFAINETAEATKGKTLSVNVGSAVVANALRRGQERASASKVSEWAWKAGGGPREVGNKIFRMLDIEEGADARVVVEQALRKVGH